MKVALVQDWLTTMGGAEKVFKEIIKLYPNADVYTLVYNDDIIEKLGIKKEKVTASYIQKLPFARTKHRNYLPLFKKAIESFDLTEYDLIISSSYSVAKGVLSHGNQTHICYCHSPVRYAWDLYHQYMKISNLKRGPKTWMVKRELHKLRIWDVISANRVDYFISNSDFIKTRINKIYRREAETIYPPVDLDKFTLKTEKEDFYITCSRLVPYKKVDLIVKAFQNMPDKKLKVIGTGPELKRIKRMAGPNVEMMGFQSDEILRDEISKARGFIFAAKEDFGIVPVEAQACGTPVIAFAEGGSLETVINHKTGVYFYEQTASSIEKAIAEFEYIENEFNPLAIREHAEKFDTPTFHKNFKKFIDNHIDSGHPRCKSVNKTSTPLIFQSA